MAESLLSLDRPPRPPCRAPHCLSLRRIPPTAYIYLTPECPTTQMRRLDTDRGPLDSFYPLSFVEISSGLSIVLSRYLHHHPKRKPPGRFTWSLVLCATRACRSFLLKPSPPSSSSYLPTEVGPNPTEVPPLKAEKRTQINMGWEKTFPQCHRKLFPVRFSIFIFSSLSLPEVDFVS